MSRMKNPKFNEKHLKALALIEKGGMSLKDIGAAVGWKQDYMWELYEGDTSKAGEVAAFFKAEVRKIDKKITGRIKDLAKSNKELAHKLIYEILKRTEEAFANKNAVSMEDKKLVGTLMNALAKATPHVEIENLSYSYTKGYTADQLIYEYNRLQTLAGSSSNRGAVQGTPPGRAGTLPGFIEPGSSAEEEQ